MSNVSDGVLGIPRGADDVFPALATSGCSRRCSVGVGGGGDGGVSEDGSGAVSGPHGIVEVEVEGRVVLGFASNEGGEDEEKQHCCEEVAGQPGRGGGVGG